MTKLGSFSSLGIFKAGGQYCSAPATNFNAISFAPNLCSLFFKGEGEKLFRWCPMEREEEECQLLCQTRIVDNFLTASKEEEEGQEGSKDIAVAIPSSQTNRTALEKTFCFFFCNSSGWNYLKNQLLHK